MRARPLAPEEIENLSKEQILGAISRSDGDTFVTHCGEVFLIDHRLAERRTDTDRDLSPASEREARATLAMAEKVWQAENDHPQAENERLQALI